MTTVFAGSERLAALDTLPPVASLPLPPRTLLARLWQTLRHALAWLGVPSAEAALAPSALRFYHGDHLGSSNVITDGAGAVVELAEYTPFGTLANRSGSATVAHKFTGQRQDTSNGLVLFPGRVYDPSLGRFLQPDPFVQDPADPQMLNRYSYVRNNPLKFVDPSGYRR